MGAASFEIKTIGSSHGPSDFFAECTEDLLGWVQSLQQAASLPLQQLSEHAKAIRQADEAKEKELVCTHASVGVHVAKERELVCTHASVGVHVAKERELVCTHAFVGVHVAKERKLVCTHASVGVRVYIQRVYAF